MEYGPAPEDDAAMNAWLESHDRHLGLFIGGEFVHGGKDPRGVQGRDVAKSYAPSTGDQLAFFTQATEADADRAVDAARKAQKSWSGLSNHERARHIYSIARHIQKHSRLISVLEAMDNGKTVRETRDVDIPLAVRHFYAHAGWAQIMDKELPNHDPLGVVAQIIPWNFPFLMLAWKIAPAIAMGNTVVLKPAPQTYLSAALFCDILAEAGLPPGVVNIIPGPTPTATHLLTHPDVDKVAFTGSTEVGQLIRRQIAGTGKKLTLELGGKSPFVVFDSADLDSAVEGVVQAIFFNQGQVCCAGSRLLVQESVADRFVDKIKSRMKTLRTAGSLDKCVDMGAIVDRTQRDNIDSFVNAGRAEGNEIFQVEVPTNVDSALFYPPTLVTNVHSASTLVQEEIFGPVLTVQTFRTPKEAVSLANNTKYGLGASVWTENIGLALETAVSVKAGVVWVNGHNMFDAAAGFGGYRASGFGREGGREGLYVVTL
jgi:aldehyde dehydrogenase (NAD+)